MQQRAGEQRLGARHGLDRRLLVAEHFILGHSLDQDGEAAALEHELQAVLEPDPPRAVRLVSFVEDLDNDTRQLAEVEVPTPLGRGAWTRRLGVRIHCVLDLADRVVELLLEPRLAREQVAQCELELARVAALRPVAVQPPLEQRVLVGQVGHGVLERGYLCDRLGLERDQLGLERRELRAEID